MGRARGWASEKTGRAPMRSPGRPGANQRKAKQAVWKCIAEGLASEVAALACGVSQPLGPRWFREAGGMAPLRLAPPSGRYLSFAEREELALLRTQHYGMRKIARQLGRSPSRGSRELRRNAETRGGTLKYRATVAQWKAERAAKRPKLVKLAENDRLRTYRARPARRRGERCAGSGDSRVQYALAGQTAWPSRRSVLGHLLESGADQARPAQVDFPHYRSMRISHEPIHQALYVQGRGVLRRELRKQPRSVNSALLSMVGIIG